MQISGTNLLIAAQQAAKSQTPQRPAMPIQATKPADAKPADFEPISFKQAAPEAPQSAALASNPPADAKRMGSLVDIRV